MKRWLWLITLLLICALRLDAQTISALSFSPSESTIVATWTTNSTSDSHLLCNGKAAVDDGFETSVTSHHAIVVGLLNNFTYSCTVTSGSTTASPQNVTTLAAPTRTPITAISYGTPLLNTDDAGKGDTYYNFTSSDGLTYVTRDDINAGSNMAIYKYGSASFGSSSYSRLTLSSVNALTAYGNVGTSNGTDGPGGLALTNKLSGIFGMLGNLYGFQTRNLYNGTGRPLQTAYYANIMKSTNKGTSWNSWQAPGVFNVNGVPPSPLGSFQFGDGSNGWVSPLRYAVDDGTIGYLTAGNRIDGADAFVYITWSNYWDNGTNIYLMRMPRVYFDAQSTTQIQYWNGPASPSPSDFVNDSNWTGTWSAGLPAIYTSANQIASSDMVFIPTLNRYLFSTWYYPSLGANAPVTSSTTWVTLEAPTPAGPWTQAGTTSFNPSGEYNPVFLHQSFATNTQLTNVTLSYVSSGDWQNATYIFPTYGTITLNPQGPSVIYFQGSSNAGTSSTSLPSNASGKSVPSTTFNLTAGNSELALVLSNGAATVTGCTDTAGNTLTNIGSVVVQSPVSVTAFLKNNVSGNASNVVTCTLSGAQTFNAIGIWQLSPGTYQFDQMISGNASSVQSVSTNAFNTAFPSEVAVVLGYYASSGNAGFYVNGNASDSGSFALGTYAIPGHQTWIARQSGAQLSLAYSQAAGNLYIAGVAVGLAAKGQLCGPFSVGL